MELIEDGIRKIFLQLSVFIYKEIANFYEIFERLCKSRILDTDTLNSISQRVGMLLGIIMLFIVSFSIIQMILEPDKLTDKEKGIGNIAKKIIMVIVMLGTSSAVFNMLYGVQTTIIESKIISKFLLPYYVESKHFGGVLSSELFTTFFKSQDKNYDDDIENLKMDIIEANSYHIAYEIVNDRDTYNGLLIDFGDLVIDWNWFLCPLFGGFVLYIIFTYCITVGTRTIQLAFLEIISPAAIISYLSPKKDTMFEKWWKIYLSTYLDALIRIMIINLAVFLVSALLDKDFSITFWNSVGGENLSGSTWIKIFMILAILTFAKKAPDLLKELFPAGASKLGLGVTSPKQLFSNMLGGNLVKGGLVGAAGFGIGAAVGAIGNAGRALFAKDKDGNPLKWRDKLAGAKSGLLGGAWSGAKAGAGAKGIGKAFGASNKAAGEQSRRIAEWRANGGVSPWQRWKTGVTQRLHLQTESERIESKYEKAKEYSDAYANAKKKAEAEVDKFSSNYIFEALDGKTYSLKHLDKLRNDASIDPDLKVAYDDIYQKIRGFARDHAMLNNGAIDGGTVTWKADASGNWDAVKRSITEDTINVKKNREIEENMKYILNSEEAKKVSGTDFEKADKANTIYEGMQYAKINDEDYKRAKADSKYNEGKK